MPARSVLLLAAATLACAVSAILPAQAAPLPVPPGRTPSEQKAPADRATVWCRSKGGAVTTYPLAAPSRRSVELCEFTAADGSQIALAPQTLDADRPTQAQRAYVRKQPPTPHAGGANPASIYCSELGGDTQIAQEPAGQVGLCVFPDGSIIDEWGLHYHAAGVIRGADLTDKFRARIAGT